MKRALSITIILALICGFIPLTLGQTEAVNDSFDTEKYGDTQDIGPYLRDLADDEAYLEEAEEKIKDEAEDEEFDEGEEDTESDDNFTFDGGTKLFLNRDLEFKDFTLRSEGDTVEIWVADDLSFEDDRPDDVVTQEQVDIMKESFEDNIYTKDTEFFGDPDSHDGSLSPLVDMEVVPEGYYEGNDKIIILVDNVKDDQYYDPDYPFYVAGFYHPTFEYYIDRNIITIDTKNWEERLEETYLPTVTHEFQHLIHDDNDSDEETWLNEGMSMFAEYLCFDEHSMGHVNYFLEHPENSLVQWGDYDETEVLADYGQAYLLMLYMNDKYGQDFIQSLAKDEDHGISGTNKILTEYNTGIDFDELFRRFSIAVAIDSDSTGKGIYEFDSIDINVDYESALSFDKDGVPAWGTDYKELDNSSQIHSIKVDGIDFLSVPWDVTTDPLGSEESVLWAGTGHEVNNQIIFDADLSNVDSATLSFDNYYFIEEQWDFGIVKVSTDGGSTWQSLSNENTRSDIVVNGYPAIMKNLPGFTGTNTEWVNEKFDLSEFAGEEVLVDFSYMTDWGYNDDGWYIDNIEIPEIGYSNDCSSVEDFKSIYEINEDYVEYSISFINEKTYGSGDNQKTKYKVLNIDPMRLSDSESIKLNKFFKSGKNYMLVWYPAPEGITAPADFSYEIITKKDFWKDVFHWKK
jgi:hypothetical protein